MTSSPGQQQPDDSTLELRTQIDETREQLGTTVEELAAKADLKAQARAKVTDVASRVRGQGPDAIRRAAPAAVMLTLIVGAALWWRSRR